MNGFKAFKFWIAIHKHFRDKNFDLFKNKGRLKGSFKSFLMRRDYETINRIAEKFSERDFVFYIASNEIYGMNTALWDYSTGIESYNTFCLRRKNIAQVILDDLRIMEEEKIKVYDSVGVLRLLTKNKITVETVIALNSILNLTDVIRQTGYGKFLERLLLRIDKAKKFVDVPEQVVEKIKGLGEKK